MDRKFILDENNICHTMCSKIPYHMQEIVLHESLLICENLKMVCLTTTMHRLQNLYVQADLTKNSLTAIPQTPSPNSAPSGYCKGCS